MALKILGMCGSLRKGSYNRKLLQVAKKISADLGAEVSEIDLKELNLPIYDGDLEALGIPEPVQKLKAAIVQADLILLSSPEHNYSISAALKNAIDWTSRQGNPWDGKVVAILGASNGNFGTLRGQFQLRQILMYLNVFILPQPQVFIRNEAEAFNPDGSLKDPKSHDLLKTLIEKSMALAQKLKNG